MRRFGRWLMLGCAILMMASVSSSWAGPPFFTDDPEPVDFLHWEFYLASVQQHLKHEIDATLPHIEVNYGAFPNIQLHVVAPMEFVRSGDESTYGFSNVELGVKYRFVQESERVPQIGIFPLVEIPTGEKDKQLSNGRIQAFLPLWLQKSWGKLSTYGGGGFWYNPGPENRNWVFAGWQAQYDFSETVSLGGEICYHTADRNDVEPGAAFNIGGFINIDERNHILFSAGQSFAGEATTTVYLGYQMTI